MNIEEFRIFCLSLKSVEESLPFDDKILVFKIKGKMFCLTDIESFQSVNVKCNPEKAIELRAKYDAVKAGYHMSKKHWNTIYFDDKISVKQIKEWVIDSYNLVIASLPKKIQKELAEE